MHWLTGAEAARVRRLRIWDANSAAKVAKGQGFLSRNTPQLEELWRESGRYVAVPKPLMRRCQGESQNGRRIYAKALGSGQFDCNGVSGEGSVDI